MFTTANFSSAIVVRRLMPPMFFIASTLVLMQLPGIARADEAIPLSRHVPSDAIAMFRILPAQLIDQPALKLFPTEILAATIEAGMNIRPNDIDLVVATVGLGDDGQPQYGVVVHCAAAYSIIDQLRKMGAPLTEVEQLDYPAARIRGAPFILAQIDETTFYAGTETYLTAMTATSDETGPLWDVIQPLAPDTNLFAAAAIEPVRQMVSEFARRQAYAVHPDLQVLADLPPLIEGLRIRGEMNDTISLQIEVTGVDEESAKQIQTVLSDAMDSAGRLTVAEIDRMNEKSYNPDLIKQSITQYATRMAATIADDLRPELEGKQVILRVDSQVQWASAGVLSTLMLPAFQRMNLLIARADPSYNFKQIGLAMHNHHSAYKTLPPASITDKDGQPLLSWRVKLLPFLEQQQLYEQFHMDEPWDSEHNLPLSKMMPDVYRIAGVDVPDNHTVVQAIAGAEIGFGKDEEVSFRRFLDGLSNTIMVAEVNADQAVIWSKPDDVSIDQADSLAHFGGQRDGSFLALFGDGAVRKLSAKMDADNFWHLLTRAGREVVDLF